MAERTYDRVGSLPIEVEGWSMSIEERETKGDGARKTTVFELEGDGHRGRGEDVTYDADLHDALHEQPPSIDFEGADTLEQAAGRLDDVDLFPAGRPDRAAYEDYRRWGVESALLDLALKQAETDLAGRLDRNRNRVRFAVSTGLGDPPTAESLTRWLDIDPSLEFKVDVTRPLPEAVQRELIETGAVVGIDLKAQYGDLPEAAGDETPSWIGEPDPDPGFYRELFAGFPDIVFEDPAVTEATRPVLEPAADRLAWDAPIHSVEDFRTQPLTVGSCNVKPSRFGTLERLFDFLDFAAAEELTLYGGGQYELSIGRGQLHELASLFYPNGPNDVAPSGYNDPEPRAELPGSPLTVPDRRPGFGWPVE